MSKKIMLVAEMLANERGIEKTSVFEAIEAALATAASLRYAPEEVQMRVSIDPKTGEYDTFRRWSVVAYDEITEPGKQITLEKAKQESNVGDLKIGDVIEEQVESEEFGRIAAQIAKQIILQKVREAERIKINAFYSKRIFELVTGVVKRTTRDYLILDLTESVEALLPREEMIPREIFKMNDRVRTCIKAVREEKRGPQLLVSRIHVNFLKELFSLEVPEIGEEVIEIRAIARDPGLRAKIAVKTNDGRIDPVGACVGMRGSRVQAVSNELSGERVDIILWDDDPVQLVLNAMSPSEIASIMVDEESHSMDLIVKQEHLSQAIGRSGQNVRLASELTGWYLNVMSEQEAEMKHQGEALKVKQLFKEKLELDSDLADLLAQEGFHSLEEIAYVPIEEILAIEALDKESAEELQRRASDFLLAEEMSEKDPMNKEDIENLEGMNTQLADQLKAKKILTQDDLAQLATDELMELIDIDEPFAAKLIMAARAHWFSNDEEVRA